MGPAKIAEFFVVVEDFRESETKGEPEMAKDMRCADAVPL